MTEQEAIAVLKRDDDSMRKGYFCINDFIAIEVAIKALEEVEQYRAIGTLEEFRAAVDKLRAKNPIIKYKQTHDCVTEIELKCPVCGTNYVELAPCGEWCRYCGTKLDWGEEE